MCIAIGKLKGKDLPSRDLLETCWYNNPDGAGFAFNHRNMVYTKKGFMTFDAFYEAFTEYDKRYNFKDKGLLIHFRITTHGASDATMTHPFPIQSDEGALKKIEYVSEFSAIHNGIISLTSSDATKSKLLSDTAIFVRDYLTPLSMNRGWFYHDFNIQLIEKLIDSKMAIINGNGDIVKTSGFHEHEGIFYSNTSYKDTWSRKKYAAYDYSDYDYSGYNYSKYSSTNTSTKKNVNDVNAEADADGVILMQCEVGDYVEYGGYDEEITSADNTFYYIDEYGQVFMGIDEKGYENSIYAKSFEYVGDGVFYSRNLTEKEFIPNGSSSHFIYPEQFISPYTTPYDDEDDDITPLNTDTPELEVTSTSLVTVEDKK